MTEEKKIIIPAWKAYFKVAWALKTPFVFLMDTKYVLLTPAEAQGAYVRELCHLQHIPDFFDCTAFSWVMKGLAHQDKINSFGFVIGWAKWAKALHAWNCILTSLGVFQLEPQQGRMFRRDRSYRPLFVIM